MLLSLSVVLAFYLSVCLCSVCLCLPVCSVFGMWGDVACFLVVGTSLLPNLLLEGKALGMQWGCLVFSRLWLIHSCQGLQPNITTQSLIKTTLLNQPVVASSMKPTVACHTQNFWNKHMHL